MNLKPVQLLLVFLLLVISNVTYSQSAGDIVGIWLTKDGKSKVQILMNKEDRTFSGKIIWLKDPEVDGKPVKDDEGNFVLGLKILENFTFDSDEWTGGTIYDPESSNTYYCTISWSGPKKIKIRGSVDPMGWIGRDETWHRVMNK